jgi:hypothetical protein
MLQEVAAPWLACAGGVFCCCSAAVLCTVHAQSCDEAALVVSIGVVQGLRKQNDLKVIQLGAKRYQQPQRAHRRVVENSHKRN